ncbi:MAG: serine--tRNA ligase [Leptospiraceae bacterium]|nr:serine--tRNA ligase [Leptospiraceae bacterium]MCK6379954.1 serine--tRNA ligase [Leptospiraceae bacterium]NUM40086.1 serine--tRNA ligase [Leptospiraceae bacterium]
MLDLIRITENPEELKSMLKRRGFSQLEIVDKILEVQAKKKSIQTEAESLRSERNRVSKEIGVKKSKGEDISEVSESMKSVGEKIKSLEEKLEVEEINLQELNQSLPNFLDEEVPTGFSEEDNVELYKVGEKPKFDFPIKTHFEIGEELKIFDFERGVKLSGARAYTYFGLAAKLERALMNFMLDIHGKHGYEEVWVPQIVNDESMFTTGQYPKFKDEYYRMERDSLNLIPTAEVPLTNLYRDEILSEESLPICVTAHTSCFRREAGSYGRDTRGLVRVHQFQKVELVKFCKPEESKAEHKKMLADAENILKLLGLHYRVLLLCSKDTSGSSSKTYDLEVWMPGLNRYMEISSVSNFKDFQSRRGKIRYKSKTGKNILVHTVNGSGLAIGRTLAAIVENFQQKEGNFKIPEILNKYL